jgi:hypothetical protein
MGAIRNPMVDAFRVDEFGENESMRRAEFWGVIIKRE